MQRGAHSLIARETSAHPALFSVVRPLHLRDAPLLVLALSFAAGVLCHGYWQPAKDIVMTCLLLLVAAAVALRRAPRLAWCATVVCWVGLGWMARSLEPALVETSLAPYADGLQRAMTGHIVSVRRLPPRPRPASAEAQQQSADAAFDEENAFAARERVEEARYSIDVEAETIEDVTPDRSQMVAAHGGARVTLYSAPGAVPAMVPCGADVALTVRLRMPQRFLDPGVWQHADTLALHGIGVESSADARTLRVLGSHGTTWRCTFTAAQQWSSGRLSRLAGNPVLAHLPRMLRLSNTDTAMLGAMLVGDRTALDHRLRTAFERTGSFHLFVVAGVHVTLLLAGLYGVLLKLRMPRWPAAGIALGVTTMYALLTGFGTPVQRALVMSAAYLLTRLLGRGRNALNALGAACLAILLMQPHAVTESSFQMTVLAAVAIGGIAVPLSGRTVLPYLRALQHIRRLQLDPRLPPRLAQLRCSLRWLGEELAQAPPGTTPSTLQTFKRSHAVALALPSLLLRAVLTLAEVVLVTLVAEMMLALPMALYFHRMTPFAAPANLLALPLVGLLMACATVTFLTSLVHPWLAALPTAVTALLLHSVTFVVGTISSLRGADVRVPGPLLVTALCAMLVWCVAVVLVRAPGRWHGWVAAGLLPLALLLILWPRRAELFPGSLEFTAIDVGQGDSLLVAAPNGRTMLIDAGGPTGSDAVAETNTFDIGEEVVSPYLWSRGMRRLDLLVLTHAHSDHIGGMAAVLRNFKPRELWVSVDADAAPYHALLELAQQNGTVVRHLRGGDRQPWGGAVIDVLSPLPDYRPRKAPVNDDSLVLRFRYGAATILAEGDAEHASEAILVSEQPGTVTLLKVGHHGSNTSTAEALLTALQPKCAVISCGLGNHFGHPRWQVLERLQAAGVHTARTDQMGAVQYLLRADGSIQTHVLASK